MFNSIFSRTKGYEDLGSNDFAKGIESKDAVVLDVRTSGEFSSGHIPKAKNIDIMGYDFQGRIANLDKSKSYYVYCRSGGRSGRACQIMKKAGFENVYNLQSGIGSWRGKVVR